MKNLGRDEPAPGEPEPEFGALLDEVDAVSLDLFDTLLERQGIFSPPDLFYRVQERAQPQLGRGPNAFAWLRVRAEEAARVMAWQRGIDEVTFDEIYTELQRRLQLDSRERKRLQQIELDCEREVLTPLAGGTRLFRAAVQAGKIVVIASDTYFGVDFVREIVKRGGFVPVPPVFVSSAWRKTKVSGGLFDVIVRELGCPPERILHVGDNPTSDITMALSRGLRTWLVSTPKQAVRWKLGLGSRPSGNSLTSALLCHMSESTISTEASADRASTLTRTAENHLSLLYSGFAAWLLQEFRARGIRRVYFAARDGLIVKRFFELLADAAEYEFQTRYMYVSRAVLYPSLVFTDPDMARRLYSHNWDHLTVGDALRRIAPELVAHDGTMIPPGDLDPNLPLIRPRAARLREFLSRNWALVERTNEARYHRAIDYMRQEGLLTSEPAAFVDIGWHGTLQSCLVKILAHLGIRKPLFGYYLGLFERPATSEPHVQASGYLVHDGRPSWINALVRCGPSLIELLHTAGHGSVRDYTCEPAGVTPVLGANGEEARQFEHIIQPIQDRALAFVTEHVRRGTARPFLAPDPAIIARAALRPIYAPTAGEAAVFGRLKHASDFGGPMKSITGVLEWDISQLPSGWLPDRTLPIWRPGFHALRSAPARSAARPPDSLGR